MLLSVVALLQAESSGSIPATHGEAMQKELLKQVRNLHPRTDEYLHGDADGGFRPYTLSPLMGRFTFQRGYLHITPGENYWFRLTVLNPISAGLVERWIETTEPWILEGRSFRASFRLSRWLVKPADQGYNTWCGSADASALWERAARDASADPNRIRLQFYSPTCLSTRSEWDYGSSFPTSAGVFRSINRRVRHTCPELWEPENWQDILDSGVVTGKYELRTSALRFEKHDRIRTGFHGHCEYLLHPGLGDRERVWLHLLAGCCFYTGVGEATSWGLGQVRREPVTSFAYRGSDLELA